MSEENEVIEEVVEEGLENEAVDTNDSDEEVEKASKIGWTPKDHFRGDPEKWVSAKEFLRRGEEQLPLVKAELRRTQDRLAAQEALTKKLADHHKKTEQMAYDRALTDLKRQRAEAISELNGSLVNDIDDKLDELKAKKQPEQQQAADTPQFFNDWVSVNPWIKTAEGQATAEALAAKYSKTHPELIGTPEILEKVSEEARRRYPEFFPELTNPRRSQAAAVTSGSPPKAKGKKTIADLPADARDACRDFVKRGYMTEAQYIKDYFGEQA